MAIIFSSSEFTRGGGVTWDDGFIWKVSEGLVGGLGMRMEHWAGTAPAATGTSATMKGKKNRRQLRSAVNISNTLSSSSTTDPATTTIITVPVSGGGSSAGVGAGGVEAEVHVSCFKPSSARFLEMMRNCGLLVVGYFLWALSSVGKGRMGRSKQAHVGRVVRSKKKTRVSLMKKFRALRWKLWSWARLVVLTPWVFFKELWLGYFITTHYSEDYFETGIYNRGVGGITLVPVDGAVVERGRGRGSGGGKKVPKVSFGDWVGKVVQDRKEDLKFTLNAFFALVGCLFSGLAWGLAWVFLLPEDEVRGRSPAGRVSGMAGLAASEEEDDESNAQGSDAESSGNGIGKDKKSPKKVDNVAGQRRKGGRGGGGGGKKKGKKR